MDVMELRRALLQPHVQTIGGIVVWKNNVAFYRNGTISEMLDNDAFFITSVIDTGSTGQKQYTCLRQGVGDASTRYLSMRYYNDLSATSVDYWSPWLTESENYSSALTFESYGRYIVVPISKKFADIFYLRYTNGEYLIKGKNVT